MFAEQIIQLVDDHRDLLTDADHRLVQALTGNPTQAPFFSAKELAQRAGVHESSCVRLAQKLGFSGYLEMRRLIRDAASSNDAASRVSRSLTAAQDKSILGMLHSKEMESLAAVNQHVQQIDIDAAAACIVKARHVHIWAGGNAKVLAELLDRRFRSTGLPSRDISQEGRELAERLVLVGAGDVIVCFAFRRQPKALAAILAHAKRVGAVTVLIADMIAHTLSEQTDHVLAAPRGDDETFLTLTVPMLITNALFLTVAQRDKHRSLTGLKSLEQLRKDLNTQE